MQAVRYQTDHQCLIISSVVFIRQEASHLLFIAEYTVKCVSVMDTSGHTGSSLNRGLGCEKSQI